jgi:hypothetical protein
VSKNPGSTESQEAELTLLTSGIRPLGRAARLPCEHANANQSRASGVASLTPQIVLVLVVMLVLVFRVSMQNAIQSQASGVASLTPTRLSAPTPKTEHEHEHD